MSSFDLPGYNYLDPRDFYGPSADNAWTSVVGPLYLPPYYFDNYLRGEALPYYKNQWELKTVRDRHRKLVATNPFAVSALSNRVHYIVGDGLTIKVSAIEESDESLADDVKKFIDIFSEVNDLTRLQQEAKWREDEDGEAFVRLFPQRSGPLAGMTYLRFIEPELVRDPRGDMTGETSFGIDSVPGDTQSVLGYQVVDNPSIDYSPQFVPEAEVVHFKGTTRSSAKRGLPKLYQVEGSLRRAEDLLASMSAMAKTRAKIAAIRKMKGTGKTAAQTFNDDLAEVQSTDPVTGAVRNVERFALGTIITAPQTIEYEFPNSGAGVAEFVMVLEAELRSVASLLNMPEWMLTANAGNSNYSASFVAESVAVKAFQTEQERIRCLWAESRFGMRKSVIWRALEVAIDAGLFPEDLGARIRLVAEAPSLIARDQDREASTNKLYMDMKVKSRARIQQELGYDPKEEDDAIESDELAMQTEPAGIQGEQPPQQNWQEPQTRLAVNRGFGVAEALSEMLPGVSDEQLMRLAATPPNSSLQCYRVGNTVFMESHGDSIEHWQVALSPGKLQNIAIALKPEHRLKGLSRRLFGDQENEARRLGIKTIEVVADSGDGRVGHIVWPKLGFDGPVDRLAAKEPVPTVFAEHTSLSAILADPAGRSWWESNGTYAALSKTLIPEDEVTIDQIKSLFAEQLAAMQPAQAPVAVNVIIPENLFTNMKPPDIHVAAPVVNISPPPPAIVNVAAPEVNVDAPTVNVQPPSVSITSPDIHVAAPVVNVSTPPETPIKDITFNKDSTGKIVGATVTKG